MKPVLLTLCLIFALSACKSDEYWDLLVHMDGGSVVQTFAIDGFETKKDCEAAGLKQYKNATRLCVARKLTF